KTPGSVHKLPVSSPKRAAGPQVSPVPAAPAWSVAPSKVTTGSAPTGNTFTDYRRNLLWWGALIGGAVGLVIYSFVPEGPTRIDVMLIASSVAMIAAIVVGAQMGRWGGGIGAFFLGALAADVLKAISLAACSVRTWATIFAALLYSFARPVCAGQQAPK